MLEKEFKWNTGELFNIDSLIGRLSERPGKKIGIKCLGEKEYSDRYYDTRDLSLFLAGFGCRLRISDDLKIEVKFQPKKSDNAFLSRTEWLIDRKEKKPDAFARFEEKKVRDFFLEQFGFIIPGDLAAVIAINDKRTKWEIKYRGNISELTLDHAESNLLLPAGREFSPMPYNFTELELESLLEARSGDGPFRELGSLISKEPGLKPTEKNKLERSLAGFGFNLKKTTGLKLNGDESTSSTAKKIFGYYFNIALKNFYGAEIGIDDEYIHDMRVALRKLRSALQFFRFTLTSNDFNYLKNNLRWITLVLGKVRDIDVFSSKVKEFIPAEILGNNTELIKVIDSEIVHLREERRTEMLSMLHSYRFKHFLERTDNLIKNGFLRRDYMSVSGDITRKTVREILLRSAGETVKSAEMFVKNYENASDESIHKMRIRFKKLRYSIDFFSGLLSSKEKKFYDLLPPIQDVLGSYVDTFFISELCSEIIVKTMGHVSVQGVSFILKGISATMADWKHTQRSKLFEIVGNFADSAELGDFLEDVRGMIMMEQV